MTKRQLTFIANLADASDGARNGIFQHDGSTITQLFRTGDLAPDGNSVFTSIGGPIHLNNAGQFFFSASLDNAPDSTFFFDNEHGLFQVGQIGAPFLGAAVVQQHIGGLNELGQVAYSFRLDDGRRGIAVWSVPEPSGFAPGMVWAGGGRDASTTVTPQTGKRRKRQTSLPTTLMTPRDLKNKRHCKYIAPLSLRSPGIQARRAERVGFRPERLTADGGRLGVFRPSGPVEVTEMSTYHKKTRIKADVVISRQPMLPRTADFFFFFWISCAIRLRAPHCLCRDQLNSY